MYQKLHERGSEFGPAFRNLHVLRRGTTETIAEIILAESLHPETARYRFHPALLDACFQAAAHALPGGAHLAAEDEVLLPVSIERVQVFRDVPFTLWSHGRLRGTPDPESSAFRLDLEIYDIEGPTLGRIAGLQLKRVKRNARSGPAGSGKGLAVRDSMARKATTRKEVGNARLA